MSPTEQKAIEVFAAYIARIQGGVAETPDVLFRNNAGIDSELREMVEGLELQKRGLSEYRACVRARDRDFEDLLAQIQDSDRYEIRGNIGEGGMGTVQRAYDKKLDREVAIKWIKAQVYASDVEVSMSIVQRFVREACITSQLDHVGIAPIYDIAVDNKGRAFYTMKLVEGVELTKHLAAFRQARCATGRPQSIVYARPYAGGGAVSAGARWGLSDLLSVLIRVGQAVAFAHGHEVLHRDLKPQNIMLGKFGEVYVVDWGLSRSLAGESVKRQKHGSQCQDTAGFATSPGSTLGSPYYMSPEQASSEQVDIDQRSDIYSMGAILYEILSGSPPYLERGEAPGEAVFLERVRRGPMTPVDDHLGAPQLLAICRKATAYDRSDRYQDMLSFVRDLESFVADRVVSVHKVGPISELLLWARRNPVLSKSVACFVGILVVGVVVTTSLWFSNSRLADSESEAKEEAQAQRSRALENAQRAEKSLVASLLAMTTVFDSSEQFYGRLDVARQDASNALDSLVRLSSGAGPELRASAHLARAGVLRSTTRSPRQMDVVIRDCREILRIRAGDRTACMFGARASRELGRHADAREFLDRGLASNPHDRFLLFERAAHAIEDLREPELARSDLRVLLETGSPPSAEEFLLAARAAGLSGDDASTLATSERGLKHHPGDYYLHLLRAQSLSKVERLDQAQRAYRDALGAATSDFERVHALNIRGFLLLELQRPDEAETCFRQAIRKDPAAAPALEGLADLLTAAGKPGEAEHYWRRVLELDPENQSARDALRRRGR